MHGPRFSRHRSSWQTGCAWVDIWGVTTTKYPTSVLIWPSLAILWDIVTPTSQMDGQPEFVSTIGKGQSQGLDHLPRLLVSVSSSEFGHLDLIPSLSISTETFSQDKEHWGKDGFSFLSFFFLMGFLSNGLDPNDKEQEAVLFQKDVFLSGRYPWSNTLMHLTQNHEYKTYF